MIIGIVAVDQQQGIGLKNSMPWPYLKQDMDHFKKLTENNIVLMGSNTYQSLKKPRLINRVNAVVSRYYWPLVDHIYLELNQALESLAILYSDKDIFIIGGAQLYESSKSFIEKYYVTEIDHHYHCDTFFDYNYVKNNFKSNSIIQSTPSTEIHPAYKILEYTK